MATEKIKYFLPSDLRHYGEKYFLPSDLRRYGTTLINNKT